MNNLYTLLGKTQEELDTVYLEFIKDVDKKYRHSYEDAIYYECLEAHKEDNERFNNSVFKALKTREDLRNSYSLEVIPSIHKDNNLVTSYCEYRYLEEIFRWELNKTRSSAVINGEGRL